MTTLRFLSLITSGVILAGAASIASAQDAAPAAQPIPVPVCTLRIHVDGFRNPKGNLGTIVFSSADGWPEDAGKSFRHGPAPIDADGKTATAEWPDLPAGDYAVAAIHDENSNHKLDRNFIGIPKEGFGFANNPKVTFSPPSFSEALVHVTCPVTDVTIHLIYK